MAHKRAARHHKVRTSTIKSLVDEEIFLFPTEVGNHVFHIGVEIAGHTCTCFIDS